MPRPSGYKYQAPKKATAKAVSRLRKDLMESNRFTLSEVKTLMEDAHCIQYHYNGINDSMKILLNNPDGFEYHTEKTAKTAKTLYEKVYANIHTLINEFPEYVAEQNRIRTRDSYLEDIQNMASLHFPYEYSQYDRLDREYTRDKNIAGWESAIAGIFKKNMDRPSEWYEQLYTHLKDSNNFTLKFDAEESISISMHVSSWSYWVVLTTNFQGEELNSGNCSYRESEHNRL